MSRFSSRLCRTTEPPDNDTRKLEPDLPSALLMYRRKSLFTTGVNKTSIFRLLARSNTAGVKDTQRSERLSSSTQSRHGNVDQQAAVVSEGAARNHHVATLLTRNATWFFGRHTRNGHCAECMHSFPAMLWPLLTGRFANTGCR